MNSRQETILRRIVEIYVDQAVPVGSKVIAEEFGVSSATVRNDMALLEKEGFLMQPHTSAGRVPTEAAYVYYLQHVVRPRKSHKPKEQLDRVVKASENQRQAAKQLAKELVDLSGEMVIVATNPDWRYYTGVANLFQKPDFADMAQMHVLSQVIDQIDEVIEAMFPRLQDEPVVMIGSQNPFGAEMTSILVRYKRPDQSAGMLGIVGPLRMNYARNIALVERAKQILDSQWV